LKEYAQSYNPQLAQQLAPENWHNSTSEKAAKMTNMIIMGLTAYIEDMAEEIMENVAKEIIENMAEDMDAAITNVEDIKEDTKEDLIRRNAISARNLDVGQTNIL